MLIIISPKAPGKLWIDAVQMQAGDTATPDFHPCPTDALVEAREKLTDWSPPRRTPDIAAGRSVTGPLRAEPVQVDSHGRLLVGGKPYLHHSMGLEFVSSPDIIDFLARSGFSDVCIYFRRDLPLSEIKEVFDRCASNGMRIIPWLDANASREGLAQTIEALKSHPALLAWYVYDEPSNEGFAEAEERYRIAKQVDPGHPAFINYLPNKLEGHAGDIYSTDVYPIPHGTPMDAIGAVAKMAAAAAKERKPVWMWLQGTGYAYWMDREPSPRELSCMVYGSLIEGARGIYYFAQIPRSKPCWEEMRAMCVEVAQLAPVVYSLEPAPAVKCDQTTVLCRAYRYQDAIWVLAVNTSRASRRATLSLDGAAGEVEVVFEGRKLAARDGKWTDDFGQYERHVYKLKVR
ncbi:MAG: hypothetical protein H5T86_00885 [Armatimonadetes bacterium]|nr:hypothetical protein [Armatimonadota bacterium]